MKFKIGIAQISPTLGDVESNLAKYRDQADKAYSQNCDLLLFPELSLTGYFLRDMVPNVALRLDSPEVGELKKLSRQISLVAGLVEETADFRFYNTAVYFECGEIKHVHRKVYLPTYGMFDEMRYFARGKQIRAFDSRFGRMAILICEDFWHPSTVYLTYLDGASSLICLSASPMRGITDGEIQDDNARYWEWIIRFYAVTYKMFIAYANRAGFEDGVGFWGGSEILDPLGKRTAKARYYEDDFITSEMVSEFGSRRRTVAPSLRDERMLDLTIAELIRIRDRSRKTDIICKS